MKRSTVQQMLIEERRDLHQFLGELDDSQWQAQSMCADWSVLDVAAHLASVVGVSRTGLLWRNMRYGSGTDGANRRSAAGWAKRGTHTIVKSLDDPTKLGLGFFYPQWALCETAVHHQDMRRALDRPRDLPNARATVALNVLIRLRFLTGASRSSRAVSLRATDSDWSHGNGPEVQGNAEAILMALAGRTINPDELSGAGRATLLGIP